MIERIKNLTEVLNKYREAYYNGTELVSDKVYDQLFDELQVLEDKYNFRMSNSPTVTVGYNVIDSVAKVKHIKPLLSLAKTKSVDDLKQFINGQKCNLMLKLDGCTGEITYSNKIGTLIGASTRGNGYEGSDYLNNALVFDNLPRNICYHGDKELILGGENIIRIGHFKEINDNLPDGEKKYVNARGLANSSIGLLDNEICSKRHLNYIVFNVIQGLEHIDSKAAQFKVLKSLGLEVVPMIEDVKVDQLEDAISTLVTCAQIEGFGIDGLVLEYDSISYGSSLGATSHHYKNGIAYKFFDELYETTLREIRWRTSKDSRLYPTGIFDSVEIDGANVTNATLHNMNYIKGLKLGIGDTIIVSKRNCIIPAIESSETQSDTYVMPITCPSCGTNLIERTIDETTFLCCPNLNGCIAQSISKLTHFVSKKALDIDGLSEQTLQKLFDLGLVKEYVDLYHLSKHKELIIAQDGFGERSYEKLIESIEASRTTTLDKFIVALGIPNIGRSASKTLAKYCQWHFDTFFNRALLEDYTKLEDFGEILHNNIIDFFRDAKNSQWVLTLSREFTFIIPEEVPTVINNEFTNKTICITGSFIIGSRNELQEIVELLGGNFVSSVSKKTDILLCGDKAGSKKEKALNLGVRIIEEEELTRLIMRSE